MPAVATAGGLPTRLGKYEILTPLAAGGMARIYIARTTGIGSFERHVVLKLITPERANDTIAVQMFLDEARLAASLNHQNVAQVFEVGEDAGIHYLAMEYVHGQDLRALLAKAGSQGTRVPLELALTTVAGAAAGLNHAHERRDGNGVPLGIVHRDVSPSNIMIGLDGSVKLLDFGIAKAAARSVETVSGIIKGKFAYMAPEQCRGRDVDRRSDVFSLGIILYEITTQHRCFRADSDFDTMHRIVTGDVVRPTRLVQGYPQALEAIVMKALAVDANQRYQSAGLLLEAIEAFAMAARMSLSTMALGRFMREMFGETPEPWLNTAARGSGPLQPKESTISNTNASSEAAAVPHRATPPPGGAQQQVAAARTLLDLPRDHHERDEDPGHDDEPNAAEWNAKSYPTMQPSYASTQSPGDQMRPGAEKSGRTSNPNLPALQAPSQVGRQSNPNLQTLPMPMTNPAAPPPPTAAPAIAAAISSELPPGAADQFPAKPGSKSGPSHPALPAVNYPNPNTNQSGASYAYDRRGDSLSDMKLRPNRRPLWIGLFLILVGVGVVLFVGYSGKTTIDEAPTTTPDPTPQSGTTPDAPETLAHEPVSVDAAPVKSADAAAPADETVTLEIASEPSNANVMVGGSLLGKTPLKMDRPRGKGDVVFTIQLAGHEDSILKLDMSGDNTRKVALNKLPETPPIVDHKKPPVVDHKKPPVDKKPPVVDHKKPPVDKKPVVDKKPDIPRKLVPGIDCQVFGQMMPGDTRPICPSK